jgi:hypothetical protein
VSRAAGRASAVPQLTFPTVDRKTNSCRDMSGFSRMSICSNALLSGAAYGGRTSFPTTDSFAPRPRSNPH